MFTFCMFVLFLLGVLFAFCGLALLADGEPEGLICCGIVAALCFVGGNTMLKDIRHFDSLETTNTQLVEVVKSKTIQTFNLKEINSSLEESLNESQNALEVSARNLYTAHKTITEKSNALDKALYNQHMLEAKLKVAKADSKVYEVRIEAAEANAKACQDLANAQGAKLESIKNLLGK